MDLLAKHPNIAYDAPPNAREICRNIQTPCHVHMFNSAYTSPPALEFLRLRLCLTLWKLCLTSNIGSAPCNPSSSSFRSSWLMNTKLSTTTSAPTQYQILAYCASSTICPIKLSGMVRLGPTVT